MNVRKHKKLVWIITGALVLVLGEVGLYQSNLFSGVLSKKKCLGTNEEATLEITKLSSLVETAHILIRERETGAELDKFEIANLRGYVHQIELWGCGTYAIRNFNVDYSSKEKPQEGFNRSLWKYKYDGSSEKIIDLAWLAQTKDVISAYNYDFRVSPDERKLVLVEGYPGKSDYNIVIKSLSGFRANNLEDVLKVSFKDIAGSNQSIYGSIGFNEWSNDSRYFWGNIFDGADVKAYYRIDIEKKTFDMYEAPYGSLGGDALVLNPNNGYVPYDPNAYWSPDADDMTIRKGINQEEGLRSELHLRHLPTGKDILVASVDEPLWRFLPKWISDTELEYTLPSGAKKTFVIP
ncbi:MAG: hypothetical protein AAB605_01355 [Patescibacteria group bacterium]